MKTLIVLTALAILIIILHSLTSLKEGLNVEFTPPDTTYDNEPTGLLDDTNWADDSTPQEIPQNIGLHAYETRRTSDTDEETGGSLGADGRVRVVRSEQSTLGALLPEFLVNFYKER